MRDPIPRGPFDQGLFLAHFNKGKDLYEARQLEEAERELEEAYLLRPRDQKVLNLLGLVYFKQDKYEKAEEVYRKLVAESPEAHTLFYNLGLIYFKLNRLEDAEGAFLKALELTKDNPKINFYLGSIYERLQRFKDAIYQYRQAGANLMVRRVEDKIAATSPGPAAATPAPTPAAARGTGPFPAAVRRKKEVDTAEYKAGKVHEGIRQHMEALKAETAATLGGAKTVQPVSPALMAEGSPHPSLTETARFRLKPDTVPPNKLKASEVAAAAAAAHEAEVREKTIPPEVPEKTMPPVPRTREIFRFLENHLMEVDFSGKVFIKQGTIYSYSGNLTFLVKEKRPGRRAVLVIIVGTGRVILTDKHREITFMQVQDETIYVEPDHLLASEEGLTPRYVSLGEASGGLEVLALEGRGMVALSVSSKPLTIPVTPGLPVSVPASSVILWAGDLTPKIVEDRQIYEVMLPPGSEPGSLLRLEGTGRILVEQAAPGTKETRA
jgi:Flp pilus assembly protein TadD/uncharacterized protein (AIM24 family)